MISPYLQYKTYMKARYGEPLFRVPIDFNLGCPNREADGSGGCTFCNVRGSKAVQTLGKNSVEEQTREAVRFARDRYGAKKYMAYIQAFSATFGESQQPMYLDLPDAFDFTSVARINALESRPPRSAIGSLKFPLPPLLQCPGSKNLPDFV